MAQDPARRRSPGHHLPGRRIVSAKKSASTIPPFSARIARPSPPDTAANSKMKGKDYNGESRSDRRPDLRVLFGAPASTPVKSPSSFGSQILSESCSAKANTNARTDPAVPGEKGRVRRQRLPPPRNLVTSQSPGRERRRARTERRLGLDWTRGPGAVPDGWGTPGDAEERNASGRPRCRNGGAEGGLSPGRWEPAPAGRRNAARRGMRPDRGKDRNSFGRKWHLYSPPGVDGRRTCSLASFWKGRGVRGGFRNGRHLRRRPGLETTSLSSARRSSREKERSRRPVGFLEWCGGFGWIDLSRGDSGSQLGLGLRASTIIPLMIESEGRDELLSARRGGVVELVGPVGRGAVLRRSSSIEGARRRRGREGSFTDWREESQETEDPDDEAGRGLRERIRRTSVAASGIFSLIKDRVTGRRELGWGSAQQMQQSDNEEGETVR